MDRGHGRSRLSAPAQCTGVKQRKGSRRFSLNKTPCHLMERPWNSGPPTQHIGELQGLQTATPNLFFLALSSQPALAIETQC